MSFVGSYTVIGGGNPLWGPGVICKLHYQRDTGKELGPFLHFDGNSLKANGGDTDNANFRMYQTPDAEGRTVVILEHAKSRKVMAVDKENDTVTLEDPSEPLDKLMKKSVEVAPYKILFHKRWGKDGYGKFYLQSLLDDKQRIVGFDENGELKKTMVAQPDHPESLFKIY